MDNMARLRKNCILCIGDQSAFWDMFLNYATNNEAVVRLIRGRKCYNTIALFDEFSAVLQFPYYFGENWAAFDECINDLGWIRGNSYELFIDQSYKILEKEQQEIPTFLKIMKNAVQEWVNGRNYNDFPTMPTNFDLLFHSEKQYEKLVRSLLEKNEIDYGIHKL